MVDIKRKIINEFIGFDVFCNEDFLKIFKDEFNNFITIDIETFLEGLIDKLKEDGDDYTYDISTSPSNEDESIYKVKVKVISNDESIILRESFLNKKTDSLEKLLKIDLNFILNNKLSEKYSNYCAEVFFSLIDDEKEFMKHSFYKKLKYYNKYIYNKKYYLREKINEYQKLIWKKSLEEKRLTEDIVRQLIREELDIGKFVYDHYPSYSLLYSEIDYYNNNIKNNIQDLNISDDYCWSCDLEFEDNDFSELNFIIDIPVQSEVKALLDFYNEKFRNLKISLNSGDYRLLINGNDVNVYELEEDIKYIYSLINDIKSREYISPSIMDKDIYLELKNRYYSEYGMWKAYDFDYVLRTISVMDENTDWMQNEIYDFCDSIKEEMTFLNKIVNDYGLFKIGDEYITGYSDFMLLCDTYSEYLGLNIEKEEIEYEYFKVLNEYNELCHNSSVINNNEDYKKYNAINRDKASVKTLGSKLNN